jgi:hypothetical protein
METVAMKKASMQKRRSEDAPPPETYKVNIPCRLPIGVEHTVILDHLTTVERGRVLLESARKAKAAAEFDELWTYASPH